MAVAGSLACASSITDSSNCLSNMSPPFLSAWGGGGVSVIGAMAIVFHQKGWESDLYLCVLLSSAHVCMQPCRLYERDGVCSLDGYAGARV